MTKVSLKNASQRWTGWRKRVTAAIVGTLLISLAGVPLVGVAQLDLSAFKSTSPQFLTVDEAYQLEVEQTTDRRIRLYWQIADGYYLYQHQFKVKLEDANGVIGSSFEFPPAKEKVDEFFGEVQVYYQNADISLVTERSFGTARLAVTSQGCADAGLCYPPNTQVFTLDAISGEVRSGEPTALGAAATTQSNNASAVENSVKPVGREFSADNITLLSALMFAFVGGLILNAMPCVFPILSLKVLSFATGDPTQHHRHAWWYLTGVVLSFVGIASVLASLQNAGQLIGWGFQLQSPGFVIGLAYLFTAMGLSLSGVIHFGGGLMNMGNTLAGQGGNRGSFFTGVLAVVVASPCTAPFMGSALGFALTQPTFLALGIFAALGLGMASPMVLLSYSATARAWLPKPGPWMETLKELLAFPLYVTAVWLLWVAGKQTGIDTMASALAGLVLLALSLYLYRGNVARRVIAVAMLGAAIALGTYRDPLATDTDKLAPGTVAWSPEALEELRNAGVPVFVDVTADWCITCLANEQTVLFTERTRAAFENAGVVYMIADWTNYDEAIGGFVKSHGRNGIPLYVMYPAKAQADPFLLPQLLTFGVLEEALAVAAQTDAF